jgi:hypothetical protein
MYSMLSAVRRLLAIVILSFSFLASRAQPESIQPVKKEVKPYKVLTSGKQITIRSTKNIQHVMLWTTGGHRVVEQREINSSSFAFTIPVNEKIFFLMVGMDGGKIYTEKIGTQ